MSVELDTLEITIQSRAEQASTGIDKLTNALAKLKSVAKGGAGLTAVTNQLNKLSSALSGININAGKMGELANALNKLADVQKASGLSSTVNALKKLPDITKQLDATDLGAFAKQMERVAAAVKPLADEMQKVSNGFSAFPIRIQKIIQSNEGLALSNNKAAKSFGVLGTGISAAKAKFGIYLLAFRKLASVMSGWVQESNDYVENLNLFTVAMGDYAQQAKEYAELVQQSLGIDPSEWMRNQGIFKQITSGFGVVEDKANLMSKALTQIGYDISSFFNISIEESMQKVQSGISGELEPLRRLGYALDQATLQQIAYNHGITQNISTMTQAQKSQLRFVAIMEQSKNVMGDMARTVMTPANAMRILQQQVTQLARALGNILIPIITTLLPYVQAFVMVLTEAAQFIAGLLGFELPTIDYSGSDFSGISQGANTATDSLENATDAAKKLKQYTLGFDELNIIAPMENASAGTGTGGIGGDLGIDLNSYDYDFLGEFENKAKEIAEKIKEFLKPLLDFLKDNLDTILGMALDIGAALLAWKITNKVINFFDQLKQLTKSLPKLSKALKVTAGLIISIVGMKWSYEAGFEIGRGTAELMDFVKAVLGPIAAGIGGALIASAVPGLGTGVGFAIGLTLGFVFEVIGVVQGKHQNLIDKFYETDFGKEVLSLREQIENSIADTEEINLRISNITAGIKEEDLANLTLAQQLLDDIFSLAEVENPTSAELSLIAEKVEILNGLGLEGLHIDLDPDGKLVQTKQELQGIIDKLYEQYKLEAAKDALVEAYRAQYDALSDVKEKNDQYTDSMLLYQEAVNQVKDTEGKLAEVESELNEIREKGREISLDYRAWPQELKNAFEPLLQQSLELRSELELQNVAMEETRAVVGEASQALQGSLTTYDSAISKVNEMESTFQEFVSTIGNQAQPAYEDGKDIMLGAANGIEDGAPDAKTAIEQAMANVLEAERIVNGISSPSAVYVEEGQYIMEGLAKGISDNAQLVTSALENVLNTMLDMMQSFIANADPAWSQNIMNTLLSSIFTPGGTGSMSGGMMGSYGSASGGQYATYIESFSQSLLATMNEILPPKMQQGAMQAIEGFVSGIEMYTILATDAMNVLVTGEKGILATFDKAMDARSYPSKEMEKRGLWAMQGLQQSIEDNTPLVTGQIQVLSDEILRMMDSLVSSVNARVQSILAAVERAKSAIAELSSLSVSSSVRISGSVRGYASGGYPTTGQMFLARENGPELVGTMGGRTAVVNNDQIVESVALGVYEAMVSAMNRQAEQGQQATITILLDGEQIYQSQEEIRRSKGFSFGMGAFAR